MKRRDFLAAAGVALLQKTSDGTSTGGSKTTTIPSGYHIVQGDLSAYFRGNEYTESLAGLTTAELAKQMPGAILSGVDQLFHNVAPTVEAGRALLNFEHTIAGYDTPRDAFTPRLAHMPIEVLDIVTLRLRQFDPAWKLHTTLIYQMIAPNIIDLEATFLAEDAALFGQSRYAVEMFASYMATTTDTGIYFRGQASPGAPESFLRGSLEYPGGSFLHVNDHPLPVSAARASTWGFAIDYKGQLKSTDWPRFTQPWYAGRQTGSNMVYQMMFDSPDVRFTQFIWSAKTGVGPPAWDWQWPLREIVAGREYTRRARMIWRPLIENTFEADCVTAYAAWRAA